MILFLIWALLTTFLSPGCQLRNTQTGIGSREETALILPELTKDQAATLASLQQVDDYPLYTMVYQADYARPEQYQSSIWQSEAQADWACSLFAALGDPNGALLGRNFDWDFSPALVLFTDPPDGYASAAMVDLHYLGYGEELAYGITDLPLEERRSLLEAPFLPFDGMNEAGLAVGMAAVPDRKLEIDPSRETIDSLLIMRRILDRAATVEEALGIMNGYNIDWGGGPALHYLIADRSGQSVLVEFSEGTKTSISNQGNWQAATNFLLTESSGDPTGQCWRYGMIAGNLESSAGRITPGRAMKLLEDVSQDTTQWSVVYQMSTGEIQVVMGGYYQTVHHFKLLLAE